MRLKRQRWFGGGSHAVGCDRPLAKRILQLCWSGLTCAYLFLLSGSFAPTLADPVAPVDKTLASLFSAAQADRVNELQYWLDRGMTPNAVDDNGDPLLVVAVRHRAYRSTAYLLSTPGLRVDLPNRVGETPLMIAALIGDLPTAKALVRSGAQVNREGWTPLHYAATGGHLDLARWLIEESAYIDAESPNQTTPLMMAGRHRRLNMVTLLLEEGADPSVRNQSGLSLADYLEHHGLTDASRRVDAAARAFRKRYGLEPDGKTP